MPTALTPRKLGQCVNADLAFVLASGGGDEDIFNLDATALTGSGGTDQTTFDYYAILSGSATNAANVCALDLTDVAGNQRYSKLLLYPLWVGQVDLTLSSAPTAVLLGELPAPSNTSERKVPSTLQPTLAPVETRSFVRLMNLNDGETLGFSTKIGSCNVSQTASRKIWRGLPIQVPVYGIRSVLCVIPIVGALSGSGQLYIAGRGIC